LSNVRWAPDVVFNLPVTVQERHGKKLVISVIDPDLRPYTREYAAQYRRFIADICSIAEKKGYTTVLASFCSFEGDEDEIDRIWKDLEPTVRASAERFRYHRPDDLEALFADACFVLATRFHAMILALLYRIPFFCIAYNEKCSNVLNDLQMDCWCSFDDLGSVDPNTVLNNHDSAVDIRPYAKMAQEQFSGLDQFLGR